MQEQTSLELVRELGMAEELPVKSNIRNKKVAKMKNVKSMSPENSQEGYSHQASGYSASMQ